MAEATDQPVRPQLERLLLGFALAPTVPAIAMPLLFIWLPGLWFVIASVGALFYFALRDRVRPTVLNISLAGALTGLGSWAVYSLLGALLEFDRLRRMRDVAFGEVLLKNFPGDLWPYGFALAFGFVGGVVFWACVVWRDPNLEGRALH